MPNFPDRRHNNFDVWQAKKGAKPSNPEAGAVKLYPDAEGNIIKIDENGNESSIGGSGTGSPSTFYLENYESNSPTDLFTVTGSWTLENDTDTSSKLCEKQSVKLTQVSGSLGAIAEVKGLLVPNRSIGPSIGKRLEYEYDGNTNDIYVQILESNDGTNYTVVGGDNGALFLPKSLNNGIGELQGYFKEASTHYGYRFTVATENIGAILKVGTISFEIDPKVIAEFIESNSVMLEGNDGRAITASTEDVQFNGSGNGWFSSGDDHHYKVQNSNSQVELSVGVHLTSNQAFRIMLYKNNVYYKNLTMRPDLASPASFNTATYISSVGEFVRDDELSIRIDPGATLFNSTEFHYLTIVEERKSTNVIFKGQSDLKPMFYGISTSGQAIPANSDTSIGYNLIKTERGLSYAPNQVTILEKGVYQISAETYLQNDYLAFGNILIFDETDTLVKTFDLGGGTNTRGAACSYTVELDVDYKVEVRVTATSATSLTTSDNTNVLTIYQLSNEKQPINAIPITELVENDFAFESVLGSVEGRGTNIIEGNGSWDGVGYVYTLKSGMFTVPPVVQSTWFGDGDVYSTVDNISTTSFRVKAYRGSFIQGTQQITVSRANEDYKPPQLILKGNAPLSNGKLFTYSGTALNLSASDATWSGVMVGGRKVMEYHIELGQDITASGTHIATLPSNLKTYGLMNRDLDYWDVLTSSDGVNSTTITYKSSNGFVEGFTSLAGNHNKIGLGVIIKIPFLQ